jgi:hypothetical protein
VNRVIVLVVLIGCCALTWWVGYQFGFKDGYKEGRVQGELGVARFMQEELTKYGIKLQIGGTNETP